MMPEEAPELFRVQIAERTGLKTVILPVPLEEAGPVVKIAVRKVLNRVATYGDRKGQATAIRMAISLDAKVESLTGLRAAITACNTLSRYLVPGLRLERKNGDGDLEGIPGTRFEVQVNEDDSILEDPEVGKVAWVRDQYIITLQLPPE
jgi:hypothetical protein